MATRSRTLLVGARNGRPHVMSFRKVYFALDHRKHALGVLRRIEFYLRTGCFEWHCSLTRRLVGQFLKTSRVCLLGPNNLQRFATLLLENQVWMANASSEGQAVKRWVFWSVRLGWTAYLGSRQSRLESVFQK